MRASQVASSFSFRREKLPLSFFLEEDVEQMAQKLLGKLLCSCSLQGVLTIGRIVETEAYGGISDKASHAYGGRRTSRTKVMFKKGGSAYVYLCYGLHHLFNVVSGKAGCADAVLVRALDPVFGVSIMRARRGQESLTKGPGTLTEALGIHKGLSGISLQSNRIWLSDDGYRYTSSEIKRTPRVGVDYAEEDAKRPWRFLIH